MTTLGRQAAHASVGQTEWSDRYLWERVDRALKNSGYMPLKHVEVRARDGRVLLHGEVPSFYLKQVAQATALAVDGVDDLENDLLVA